MTYNFNFAVSATIDAKTVQDMIKSVVEQQTGRTVTSVELKMRTVTKGYQRDEYTETVFDGATVFFENETMNSKNKGFKTVTYNPEDR